MVRRGYWLSLAALTLLPIGFLLSLIGLHQPTSKGITLGLEILMMVAAAANLASFVAGGRLREAKGRRGSVLYILLNAALLCLLMGFTLFTALVV